MKTSAAGTSGGGAPLLAHGEVQARLDRLQSDCPLMVNKRLLSTGPVAVYARSMSAERYEIESDPDGTWSVIDVDTGLPYETGGLVLEGLDFEMAGELAWFLNNMDRQRKRPH
ncbi:MAG: hypothetical protein E5X48_11175 [Mesorhizobium sp.]|nr:MAG: hypothetical protein E5X48_11175 [Mesorhizobium sp.]